MAEPRRDVAIAAASGLLFAVGLGVAGMTRPDKVMAFLRLGPGWDPSLLVVMGAAVPVHALAWACRRRVAPQTVPAPGAVDARLVVGAGLFGVGWGLVGACPGPALVSLVTGGGAAVFVGAMAAGMALARVVAVPGSYATPPNPDDRASAGDPAGAREAAVR